MRYALKIAYDGREFGGFQIQELRTTIQSELERVGQIVLREKIQILPAGRTDAGVHATGQVCHLDLTKPLTDKLVHSWNAVLPSSIRVMSAGEVDDDFHARFSCLARSYEYLLTNHKSPHLEKRALYVHTPIDWEKMNPELAAIQGENDFKAFCKMGELKTIRFLDKVCILPFTDPVSGLECYSFQIRANAFLHNMVRIIVGTTLDRIRGRIKMPLSELLLGRDRTLAGVTAPAHGLYLRNAYYPKKYQSAGLSTFPDDEIGPHHPYNLQPWKSEKMMR